MALFCFENTFAFSKAHLLEYAGRSWGLQQTRFAPYVPKEVCAQTAWVRWGRTGAGKEVSVCRNGGRICVESGSLSPRGQGLEAEEEKGETGPQWLHPGRSPWLLCGWQGEIHSCGMLLDTSRCLEEDLLPLGAAALLHQLQTTRGE